MISIKGYDITMVLGDTESISLTPLNPDGTVYDLAQDEYVEFIVKEKAREDSPTLLRRIAGENFTITFDRDDTWNLETGKKYVYNARVENNAGTRHITFLVGKFVLAEVVESDK